MQTLVEQPFVGCWKSYKTFKHSGAIQLYTEELFKEFTFGDDRQLSIQTCKGIRRNTEVLTDNWSIEFSNKRHYLSIRSLKKQYEVITVNHTVLVLLDTDSNDKTFYAKDCFWKSYLKSNKLQTL